MDKICIFNTKVQCTACGKCDICDLDNRKSCNNCGKCLQDSGIDMRGIKIDEVNDIDTVYEDKILGLDDLALEAFNYDEAYVADSDENYAENNDPWELIDDIDGLSELMEDDKSSKNLVHEVAPGFYYLDKRE